MANNDWYYEPPSDSAWDAYCDQTDWPTDDGFDAWMQEQEDRRDDALIERAEQERDFEDMDRDYGDEY